MHTSGTNFRLLLGNWPPFVTASSIFLVTRFPVSPRGPDVTMLLPQMSHISSADLYLMELSPLTSCLFYT